MQKRHVSILLGFVLTLAAPLALAAEDEEQLDAVHHTIDGYYLDFAPVGHVELPRIFLVRRDGSLTFEAFGSSSAAVTSGLYHIANHGEGDEPPHEGDGHETVTHPEGEGEHASEAAEQPYDAELAATGGGEIVVDFSISRHLVFIFLAMIILALLLIPLGRRYKKGVGRISAPRGLLQNMIETLVIYVRDEIAKPNIAGEKYKRYMPYLLTVFFFILLCNLLGLVPWSATATANISVTATLAIFTFVITQLAGTKDYWKHIFNPPGIPHLVKPIMVPVEILGLFTKPFALAIRLFANMTAGHLVILNMIGLIFIIGAGFGAAAGWGTAVPALLMTVFVYTLEVLIAFLQAYIFTILSALFIGMAAAEHEHDHDHSYDEDIDAHDIAVSESSPIISHHEVRQDHEVTVGTEGVYAFAS